MKLNTYSLFSIAFTLSTLHMAIVNTSHASTVKIERDAAQLNEGKMETHIADQYTDGVSQLHNANLNRLITPHIDSHSISSSENTIESGIFEKMTDANCVDGQYNEIDMGNPGVNIDQIMAHHRPYAPLSEVTQTMYAALELRYPFGAEILQRSPDKRGKSCAVYWLERASNIWRGLPEDELFHAVDLAVHECGHALSHDGLDWSTQPLHLAKGVSFRCPVRGIYQYPPLHNLQYDKFSRDVPNNTYDDTYIDRGSPIGDQGWESIIDEAVQYSHSLSIGYAFYDYTEYGSSADGGLSFVWYIQRYLYFLRNNRKDIYNEILDNDCWRNALLTLWGKIWRYEDKALSVNEDPSEDNLTSKNTKLLLKAVQQPELMAEIQAIRNAHQCY